MKQPPKGAKFIKRRINKQLFLQGVKGRLLNDLGNYFNWIEQHYFEEKVAVGFWGSMRIVFPVIEAVCEFLARDKYEFMSAELGVETPYLVWDMFRHSLIHNDNLQHARFGDRELSWSASIGGGHSFVPGAVSIDSKKIYDDLIDFLTKEIECSVDSQNDIDVGIEYLSPKPEIQQEFVRLFDSKSAASSAAKRGLSERRT